jgi:hypothetical protein
VVQLHESSFTRTEIVRYGQNLGLTGLSFLGWTVALNAVWAAAMTAATLFLVVLGAVVDVFVDEVQPTADWYVSRMLVAYDLLTGVDLLTVLA